MDCQKSVDIDDVVRSLETYVQRSQDEREARNKYDGYSWGYYGSALIAERDEARQDFKERLDAYIDARIAAAMATGA